MCLQEHKVLTVFSPDCGAVLYCTTLSDAAPITTSTSVVPGSVQLVVPGGQGDINSLLGL